MTIFSKYLFWLHKPNNNNQKDNEFKEEKKKGYGRRNKITRLLVITIFLAIITPFIKVEAAFHPWASLVHAVVSGLVFVILIIPILIGGAAVKLASVFMSHTLDPNFFPIKFTQMYQGGAPTFVGTGWAISRDLSYMIIVIALIAAGLGIALRIFEAQKILASIIIAALVIPFTPLICGLIIDPANILTNTFLQSGATTNITSFSTIIQNFGDLLHNSIYNAGPSGSEQSLTSSTAGAIMNSLVYLLTIFMIAIAMFLYGAVFIVRGIALFFIVIFGPLAVTAYIFPQTRKWFSQWFEQLTGWAFVAPVAVFFLYLTGEMIHTLYVGVGAQNLGLGSFAYFMIPPLTMYAGLAAISAVGPAGAKATVGIVKKHGGALVGGGLKWGKERFTSSKLGRTISERMQKAGGENRTLEEATAGKTGIKRTLAWAGWGIKRNFSKALNTGGNKLAVAEQGIDKARKQEAEKLVGATFDNVNGDSEKAIEQLGSSALSNPLVAMSLHDRLEKNGKLNLLAKHPHLLNLVGEQLARQNPGKAISTLTPLVMKNKVLQNSMGPAFKRLLTEKGYNSNKEISDARSQLKNAYAKVAKTPEQKVMVQDIVDKETNLDNVGKDMTRKSLSNKQISMLRSMGIKDIDAFIKGVNNTKAKIQKTNVYTSYQENPNKLYTDTADSLGIKSIKAKSIQNGEISKDILTNDDVIKGLINEGKAKAINAGIENVEGYSSKVANTFNKMTDEEKKEILKKHPEIGYMFIKPGPLLGLGKDEKGNTLLNAKDVKNFIERLTSEGEKKKKIEIAHG